MDNDINAQPLISIIMPAYNAARYIGEAISSVCTQTYTNWELVVIDDGSIDNTAAIIKKYQGEESRIKYHLQENKGLGAARNAGLMLAQGSWIAFLDADDIWIENKLEAQADVIASENPDLIYSNGFYLSQETQALTPYDAICGLTTGDEMYCNLIDHNTIPVLSVCMSRELINKIGFQYTQSFARGSEDWDYWLRASLQGARFFGMKQRLFKYRVHRNNMSGNTARMLISNVYVLTRNYQGSRLSQKAKQKVKNLLASAIVLMLKKIPSVKRGQQRAYLKMFAKAVAISGASLITFIFRKSASKLIALKLNGG